ncbi:hypothetical protein V8D89_004343 [Ganoderma adspersum]
MIASSGLLLVSLITRPLPWASPPLATSNGFSRVCSADPNQTLKLRLALVQGNVSELERKLYDVSTPSSPNYGKHLSMSEASQLVAPAQESVDVVNAWLKDNEIVAKTISPSGDWLSFEVPVGKANQLFDADFSVFKHDNTGVEAVRALSYSIPAELQGHLDLVHPTVTFPSPRSQFPVFQVPVRDTSSAQNSSGQAIPSSCSNRISPACLQAIYHIPTEPATQPESNQLAVTGFLEQYVNEADLKDPSQAGDEANLDIQYTIGVATGVPTVFISVGPSNDGGVDDFLDVAHFLLSQNNPPNVLTTSYGIDEGDVSPKLARNLCNAYAQLGARSVTVLFTSGDGGVSGSQLNDTCTLFIPTFPSGCPFVTSVGASQGVPEVAADLSAGGFSNIFSTPDYQASAVYEYLSALGNTYEGRFNPSGRAYPDVAVQGVAYEIVLGGVRNRVDGTSASTPVFASIVSLLNDRLIAQGQTPLGFLNPFLYVVGAAALNDVMDGSNPGCNTNGFPAGEGWDPVTGLGTPDFERLAFTIGL